MTEHLNFVKVSVEISEREPKPRKCPKCATRVKAQRTPHGWLMQCCGLWSWGGWPLVCKETHKARKEAHDAFDPLWKEHLISRGNAYQKMAKKLGVGYFKAHMKTMDLETARKVPAIAAEIRAESLQRTQGSAKE